MGGRLLQRPPFAVHLVQLLVSGLSARDRDRHHIKPSARAAAHGPGAHGPGAHGPIPQFHGLNDSYFPGFVLPRSPGSDGRETAE